MEPAGCLSYEYICRVEPTVPRAKNNCHESPLSYYMLADSMVIFDRAKQTIRLLVNARTDAYQSVDKAYRAAIEELQYLQATLEKPNQVEPAALKSPENIQIPDGNFIKEDFEDLVERSKDYIRAGDIFQVVLSQRFEKSFKNAPGCIEH